MSGVRDATCDNDVHNFIRQPSAAPDGGWRFPTPEGERCVPAMTVEPAPIENATDYPCPGWHPDRDAPGQPIWCRPCQDHIITTLNRLTPHLLDLAGRTDGRINRTGSLADSDPVHAHQHPAPASPSPAWDSIDRAIHAILRIEDVIRDVAAQPDAERLAPRTSRYHGLAGGTAQRLAAFNASVAWLTEYRTALLAHPDAYQHGTRILHLHRDLERVTGQDRLIHRLPVPCPKCDYLSLVREDGDDKIRCTWRECRLVWAEDQYRWFTRVAADGWADAAS